MPRVVVDQKSKFETDELFKKLSQETDVRYRYPVTPGNLVRVATLVSGQIHRLPGQTTRGEKNKISGRPHQWNCGRGECGWQHTMLI